MDRVVADETLERLREVDDLAHLRVGVVGLLELGARLQALLEVDLRAFRDHLRDPVDLAVRDLEHAACVAHGGPGEHRPERDDLGDPVAAVLLLDVVDHPVSPGNGEVDVHVGHGLAARIEEALEEEVVSDRIDVRDLERVGGDGSRGRSSPRADLNPVLPGEADEVPDDQEVVGEAHLLDRLQLELDALLELRRDGSVPLLHAFLAQLDEVVEGVAVVGRRERREPDLAQLQLDVQPLGDLEARAECVRVVREVLGHLGRGLEVELVRVELPVIRVLERVAGLDAEERLVGPRVLVAEVVDVAGSDEREARVRGELREQRVDPRLLREAGVLHLDVDVVAPEDLRETVEVGSGILWTTFLQGFTHSAREAPGERHEPLRVSGQVAPVDARLVVVALEESGRGELDQVPVALVRLGEERQVRVALLLLGRVVADVDLAADQRLDALLPGVLVELDGAGERAVVGERDGRHLELRGAGRQIGDPAGPVEDREFGVDVEVDELGSQGRAILAGTPASPISPRRRRDLAPPVSSSSRC